VSKRLPLILWLLGAPAILALIFGGPIERNQEARVLETAREMIGAGWKNWLIPHCNGQVRLRKPPLAYWAAADSFEVLHVHDWAGRIPFALASWLTLWATYAAARPIIGRRGALLASAGLAGTYFFVRFGRYAETDILAAFFITAAIAAIVNGALARRSSKKLVLHFAAGISIGLAVMSKGPPAIFPVLFLIGLAAVLHRWQILGQFLLTGLIAATAVALPWWIYISHLPQFKVIGNELRIVTMGVDHPGPPWFYFLVTLLATTPWCGFVVLGIGEAIRRFRRDLRARIILLWIGCIIIPLSLLGNKQDHYMMPLLPPLMAAAGWAIDQGLRGRPRMVQLNRGIFAGTAIACIVASAGPIIEARQIRGKILPIDWALAAMVLVAGVVLFVFIQRAGRQMLSLGRMIGALAIGAIVMILAIGFWRRSLEPIDYPKVADAILLEYGDRDLALYEDENLPICFYSARTLPYYATRDELQEALARNPRLVIIWEQKRITELPPGKEVWRLQMSKRDIVIFEQK
jgi:4-amino-4-deoxy-L-arabinose transferase-like glycosyltransferase